MGGGGAHSPAPAPAGLELRRAGGCWHSLLAWILCYLGPGPEKDQVAPAPPGLFEHVLFQDSTFFDSISASELAMRCGVDMMNIRVLVGFLAQKLVKVRGYCCVSPVGEAGGDVQAVALCGLA